MIVDVTTDSRIMKQGQGQLVVQVGTLKGESVSDTSLVMRIVHLKDIVLSKIFYRFYFKLVPREDMSLS